MFRTKTFQFKIREVRKNGQFLYGVRMFVDAVMHGECVHKSSFQALTILMSNHLTTKYQKELRKLNADNFYGLDKDGRHMIINPINGFLCVNEIIKAMGYELTTLQDNSKSVTYIFYKDNQ
jgi:hypothetical protein